MKIISAFALFSCFLLTACATPIRATEPSVRIGGHEIAVELATDAASRERGLMFRSELEKGHGMLFAFPQEQPRWFWMKNTLIPLDILYFDSNAKLVSMQLNVPPCKSDPCPSYASNGPARYVLELNGGAVDRLDIETGDVMRLPDAPLKVQ